MYADSFIRRATEELIALGAHTVLLYGSRADGSATQQSDYDLAAFGGVEAVVRDEGPKKSLHWLSEFDRKTFDAFNLALAPGADLSEIAGLVPLIVGSRAEVDR